MGNAVSDTYGKIKRTGEAGVTSAQEAFGEGVRKNVLKEARGVSQGRCDAQIKKAREEEELKTQACKTAFGELELKNAEAVRRLKISLVGGVALLIAFLVVLIVLIIVSVEEKKKLVALRAPSSSRS